MHFSGRVQKVAMKRLWTAIVGATLSLSAWPCGSPRWPVKTGTDRDIEAVRPHPVPTTIDQLRKLVAPADPTIRGDTRYAPTELTVYEVTGTLMVIDPKKDEDYHLVIADEHGRTFIAESPAPRCVKNGRFAAQITGRARRDRFRFRTHRQTKAREGAGDRDRYRFL